MSKHPYPPCIKFYAVRRGKKPGIYLSWDECQKQTAGYSGAVFKKFDSSEEAEDFIEQEPVALHAFPEGEASETKAVAYVDGSYNADAGEFAFGAVLFFNGQEEHLSGKSDNCELAAMRNVAGEIMGAKAAMEYASQHGAKELVIYHDYYGISAWCTGEWKTNRQGTTDYARYFKDVSKNIKITFKKVKAHTGIKYNEMADKLAKTALGLEK